KVASPSCLCCPATLRDLFRFLLVFRLSALLKWLSFFSVFLFWKIILRGRNEPSPDIAPLSEQRLVLFVIDFLNQLPKLLKMVFDNVIQIRINRQFVDTHNACKPIKRFVVFLPYIDRFAFACRSVRDFKELSVIILFGQLL